MNAIALRVGPGLKFRFMAKISWFRDSLELAVKQSNFTVAKKLEEGIAYAQTEMERLCEPSIQSMH
jgi:hypothetical protein